MISEAAASEKSSTVGKVFTNFSAASTAPCFPSSAGMATEPSASISASSFRARSSKRSGATRLGIVNAAFVVDGLSAKLNARALCASTVSVV